MANQQAKSMRLETDNGKIIMKSLLASKMKAETDNGRIEIEKSNFTNADFQQIMDESLQKIQKLKNLSSLQIMEE